MLELANTLEVVGISSLWPMGHICMWFNTLWMTTSCCNAIVLTTTLAALFYTSEISPYISLLAQLKNEM